MPRRAEAPSERASTKGRGTVVTEDKAPRILVVLGHSAAGKSALLARLGIDRSKRDMDVFCAIRNCEPSVEALLAMASITGAMPLIVCSNAVAFLDELESRAGDPAFAQFLFCYLRRPESVLYENLSLINSDGQRHPYIDLTAYDLVHREFERRYRAIASVEINFGGTSLEYLCDTIESILGRLAQNGTDACSLRHAAPEIRPSSIKDWDRRRSDSTAVH